MINIKLVRLSVLLWTLMISACNDGVQGSLVEGCQTNESSCPSGSMCQELGDGSYRCVPENTVNDAMTTDLDAMTTDLDAMTTDLDAMTTDLDAMPTDLDAGLDVYDAQVLPDAEFAIDNDDDGIADHLDNCPLEANSEQMDTDNDGLGDLCDQEPMIQNLILKGQILILGGSSIDNNYTVKSKITTAIEELTDGQFILTGEL